MKRFIWMGAGIAIGVLAMRKLNSAKQAVGPEGLNRAVAGVADSIAEFANALREGMTEREADLRTALGIDSADDVRTR
jgi:hypothetical protein